MTKKKERQKMILIASLIFGLFFGAGNLIFPVEIGQLAGKQWLWATIGFVVTGTVVPYLAMLAVSVTNSKGIYDIAKPVAPWFASFFLVAIHLSIGPFFATPRTAATAYAMGIAPLIGDAHQGFGMFVFSFIFFTLAYLVTTNRSGLTSWIGKYLNPLFLGLIAVVLLVAFFFPMGDLNQPVQALYSEGAFFTGFLAGYNTMDGLGLLAFAVTIVRAVKGLGFEEKAIPKTIAKAGLISIIIEGLLYTGLVLLGVMSLGQLDVAANGGDAFAGIIAYYAGNFGTVSTGVLITLTVFTTAVGLLASFGHDLHSVFPQISDTNWIRIAAIGSFIVANAGLTNIIQWAVPVLMFLYPLTLALIFLSLTGRFFHRSAIVYRVTIAAIVMPATIDALAASPFATMNSIEAVVAVYEKVMPFASIGLGWTLPCLVGFTIGIVLFHFMSQEDGTLADD